MTWRPGIPLPLDVQQTQERQLYHAQRSGGAWVTMTREDNTWKWRSVAGDTSGEGGWNDLWHWLKT